MSDSARSVVYSIVESVYGTTPATPNFDTIRNTGCTLGTSKGTFRSEEIRPDRQLVDFRHGNRQVGGQVLTELSWESHDDYLEAALCGTWAAKASAYAASTISAAASDNSINDSANGLPILDAGDKVTISGFTGETGNNQSGLIVVTSTASKMVLSGGDALVDDAEGEEVTITTNTTRLTAGTTRRSFSILRHFADIGSSDLPYFLYSGLEINTWNVQIPTEGPITSNFGFVGKAQAASAMTAPASSTYNAASTTKIFDSLIGTIRENGSAIATVSEVNFDLENGIAPRFTIGNTEAQLEASIGDSMMSGQITAFFEDSTLLNKFLAETESSLDMPLQDLDGNIYRFVWPRIKYNGGQPDTQGRNTITNTHPFQALMDTTLNTQFYIDKIPAVVA